MHFSPSRQSSATEHYARPAGQPLITSLAALSGVHTTPSSFYAYDPEKEPIKAFLRIRPNLLPESEQAPYMEMVDDVEVSMLPPEVSLCSVYHDICCPLSDTAHRIQMHIELAIGRQKDTNLQKYSTNQYRKSSSLMKQLCHLSKMYSMGRTHCYLPTV
jgi:hypothetical protein